ncbi:MAG: DUF805 domain-containing protein [Clostridiales Family XIII bacterium]|jgi:uncharacterized membrane protein YhaH (DUF805 family)|nr:DUF805 domain-containing protein [Clostridiales Family XIII bacterium]
MSDELNKDQGPAPQGQNQGNPYYDGGQEKMTGIVEAYASYWKNYANFRDRTSRAGYWWVMLINFIIGQVLYQTCFRPVYEKTLDAAWQGHPIGFDTFGNMSTVLVIGTGTVFFIWGLLNIIPGISLFVRRLHDINKRWTNIFFVLIPFVGVIILLVFTLIGTKRPPENRFYDLPKRA